MKRKLLTALLTSAIILTFTACGDDMMSSLTDSSKADQSSQTITSEIDSLPSQGTSSANTSTTSQQITPGSKIDEAKAKEIALNHAKLKADAITAYKIELDHDDGIPHYEIEFKVGANEYEYDINAETSEIVKAEKDDKNLLATNIAVLKSEADAKQNALNHAGLKAENITAYRIELDYDGAAPFYEIEFKAGGYEYDYDIDAANGRILKSEKEIAD